MIGDVGGKISIGGKCRPQKRVGPIQDRANMESKKDEVDENSAEANFDVYTYNRIAISDILSCNKSSHSLFSVFQA